MNREQRRRQNKDQRSSLKQFKACVQKPKIKPNEPDFSSVPLRTLCQSIQLLIEELRNRGILIYDFDNREKTVQAIQIFQGKVYFLAAREDDLSDEV